MRKLISCAALLLVIVMSFTTPAYAADVATDEAETAAPTVTEEATQNATEGNVEATEAETSEQTDPVGIEDGYAAEKDRDWLIDAIKAAKPDEVEFIKGYIEDALVAMEGIEYTEWEWIYKIIEDNVEWFACLIVGIGFLVAAIVVIVKYRREKTLINNAAASANASEKKMGEMTEQVAGYDETIKILSDTVTKALEQLKIHDDELAAVGKELIKRDEAVIATANEDVHAMILLADIVGDLIQLSNIPQIRKDEIYSKHVTAKNHINAQAMGGDANNESKS